MSDNDRVIAKRVRRVRFANELTQSAFARALDVSHDRIASIEYERTPLAVDLADKISGRFDVSLIWLAKGEGRIGPCVGLITQIIPDFDGSEILSKCFNSELEKLLRTNCEQGLSRLIQAVDRWPEVPLEKQTKFAELLISQLFLELEKAFSELSITGKESLYHAVNSALQGHLDDWDENQTNKKTGIAPEFGLTDISMLGNVDSVKAQLPALIKRLNEATKERGTKTALAKFMDVSLPKISQWLSGTHAPGGENTLKLIQWVEAQERKTKKP